MATASRSLALALLFASLLSGPSLRMCHRTAVSSIIPMMERFQAWQATYATPEEFQRRFEVYSENMEFIEATNLLELPYKLDENQFADLTDEEFEEMYLMKLDEVASAPPAPEAEGMEHLGTLMDAGTSSGGYLNNTDKVPKSVDWRKKGAVTAVKNQNPCASCWAFAAVAAIEGAHKIKTGRLVSLSEQEIVDCDRVGYDHGCRSGYPDFAMAWVMHNGGLAKESDYRYMARQGQCRRSKLGHHAATIRDVGAVPRNNEAALERAVANRPIAVSIDATSRAFQFYKCGVFPPSSCNTNRNHAVTVVGYGASRGKKYWIVKNSWGRTWGEKGYVRMQRRVGARHGVCGIAMEPYYAVV
ncbi:unnamed protein product [Urochloa decumbens]|uniref:Uncharacterized protein n=1 Tax=Urochloa decumbens TaxID=240449 RepID=A0ABC9FXG3_9POAL